VFLDGNNKYHYSRNVEIYYPVTQRHVAGQRNSWLHRSANL